MKNKLSDLNNHLFAQLERLSEEDLTAEQIEQEVDRAKAIVGVSDQIISTAALQFKAVELVANHGRGLADMIPETIAGRTIEHRPARGAAVTADPEQAEIAERRRALELAEEREEWKRQAAEAGK